MGILDGALASLFSSAFSGLYLDGTAHHGTGAPIYDAGRITGYTDSGDLAVKVQTDRANWNIRRDPDYVAGDVLLIILAITPSGEEITLTTDHQVTDGYGDRYRIETTERDAARSHWLCRGRPV